MKKHIVTLLALALCAGITYAAPKSLVVERTLDDHPTFGFDVGGFAKTSDFVDNRSGIFVGVHHYPSIFTENLGWFAEGRFYDAQETFLDEAFAGLLFSVFEGPRATFGLYGGAGLNFEETYGSGVGRDDVLIGAGVRWDTRILDTPLYFGVKAGWEKQLDIMAPHQAIGAAFISAKF